MPSFMSAMNTASNFVSMVDSFLGGGDAVGMTLSGAGESVSFPILPSEFMVANPYNAKSVNITGLGDINLKGKRGLRSLTLESFFPAVETNDVLGVFSWEESADPYGSIAKIKKMAESTEPSNINIAGTDVAMAVLIKKLDYGERDGTGDVYFSLELEEYRFISQESAAENETTGLKTRGTGAASKTENVKRGMDAMDVAHRAVHNVSKNLSLANQGARKLGAVRSIVRSGGVTPGTVIRSTADGIKVGSLNIKF